jgi:hypothetical protein
VLCAARNSTGGLAWSVYNGTFWSKFANLATSAVSAPGCATDNAGGVICAVFTTGDATLVNRFAGGGLGWIPQARWHRCRRARLHIDELERTSRLLRRGLLLPNFWHPFRWRNLGTGYWTTYASLGGEVTNNAKCTTHAAGQLVCGVIAIDNAFYADVYNGTSWSTWTKTGGTGVGIPACAALGSGQAVCVVMGVNNKLTSVVGP